MFRLRYCLFFLCANIPIQPLRGGEDIYLNRGLHRDLDFSDPFIDVIYVVGFHLSAWPSSLFLAFFPHFYRTLF